MLRLIAIGFAMFLSALPPGVVLAADTVELVSVWNPIGAEPDGCVPALTGGGGPTKWSNVETDADGRFSFVSVRPAGYPVPTDGPCGELLAAQGRKVMRPAHLHFIVAAEGYKVLATQFFDIEDPNAFEDVVFGAVGSLLRRFEPDGEGGYVLDVDLRLERGETRLSGRSTSGSCRPTPAGRRRSPIAATSPGSSVALVSSSSVRT